MRKPLFKKLDEEVTKLHLPALREELTVFPQEHAVYTGVTIPSCFRVPSRTCCWRSLICGGIGMKPRPTRTAVYILATQLDEKVAE